MNTGLPFRPTIRIACFSGTAVTSGLACSSLADYPFRGWPMKCFHLALLLSTTLGLAAADSPHERIGKAESELGAFRETKSPAALTSAYRNARDIAEVPNRET